MNSEPNIIQLPAVALRGIVVFPNNTLSFDIGREKSKNSVIYASEKGQMIYLVGQKDYITAEPDESDLYTIGVVAEIVQTVKVRGDNIRIVAKGLYRAKTVKIYNEKDALFADVVSYPEKAVRLKDETEAGALIRTIRALFGEYNELSGGLPKDIILQVMTNDGVRFLSEFIPSNLMLKYEAKQAILEESDCLGRLHMIAEVLDSEINVLSLENEIMSKVKTSMDKSQRDYMLREQMQIIADELGDGDNPLEESLQYENRINDLKACDAVKEKLLSECKKFGRMPVASHDASVIRAYLDFALSLPFGIETKDNTNIDKAEKILNRDHYGLCDVKDRILELLAVKTLTEGKNGTILCLVGPPGVGKTSVAKSIATALGRKYVRIALGGVHDEAEIRGHRKTYIGAMSGKIISAVKSAKSSNPLILLDEIDKLASDYKGDPSGALLEVLDKEQNFSFTDNYLEFPFDLSKVLFITTANDYSAIPAPLLDRMEVIELDGYTRNEKYNIAKRHLIAKQLSENGLEKGDVRITESAIYGIIDNYTREAGVRNLERKIGTVLRKCAKKKASGNFTALTVSGKNLSEFLGKEIYLPDELFGKEECGIATGLAWTAGGGEVLPVEVLIMNGTGKTEFTGMLGDVFKESCLAAVSLIRSMSDKLPIDADFYKNKDIHIHAPEGAIPKDGPSAGITITTALISALTGIPVRNDIAMTGEITLKGKVLPIGGLPQKSAAAHRVGIKTVLIPEKNLKDLEKIDKEILADIKFIPCGNIGDVIASAFSVSPLKDTEKAKHSLSVPSASNEKPNFLEQ